ncbi:MAG TPA: ABC transporter ATP-binding protein [Streptosporangiaceae bacterium]|nr:ABC transporter ATP-binding protein [Streptosporangiaceae bacterium]
MPDAILRAAAVSAGYGGGRHPRLVLHEVDLEVLPGQAVGVVGESGSGKSTLAKVLVGQLRAAAGTVSLDGTDLGSLRGAALRAARRRVQLVPQDPYGSLDPRMTVRRALTEAIDPEARRPGKYEGRVAELLRTVALDPEVATRYPHEFSGGQRQRIAIARALAVEPEVIVADEVTSSLDASVQAEILNLLRDIQSRTGVGMVFITHDLSVANFICSRICVLYLGRVVEGGPTDLLFQPDHPYTRLLVDSLPRAGAELGDPAGSAQEPADPAAPPSGCPFHPRCAAMPDDPSARQRCAGERPLLLPRQLPGGDRSTACHFPLVAQADPTSSLNARLPR